MHCPIASDHVIPEHVWSVHAEHNLWPWEDKAGQHAGAVGEVQAEGRRCSSPAGAWQQAQTWDPAAPTAPAAQAQVRVRGTRPEGRPLAWLTPGSEPGCCPTPTIRHMEGALEPFRNGPDSWFLSVGDVKEKAEAFVLLLYILASMPRLVGLGTKRLLV